MRPKLQEVIQLVATPQVRQLARQVNGAIRVYDVVFLIAGVGLLAFGIWLRTSDPDNAPILSLCGWGSILFMLIAPHGYASIAKDGFRHIRHAVVWGVSRQELVAASVLVGLTRAMWVGLCMMPAAWLALGQTQVTFEPKPKDGSVTIGMEVPATANEYTWWLTWWGLALICVWTLLAVATGCLAGFAHAMNDTSREPARGFLAKAAGVPRGFALWLLSMSALWPVAFQNCTHAAANYRSDRALSGTSSV